MANFETELVVMGAKVALKTYKLPIEPSQLKNFDEFHKKLTKLDLQLKLLAWKSVRSETFLTLFRTFYLTCLPKGSIIDL